ncbi:MAG: WYL domain-containing protein [Deltaproteobacteria bacterium]
MLRLIFIDRKIREGMQQGVLANCRTMAEEYEVSRKSILRDIDYLKNQRDAPIAYDPEKRGYYYTEGQYALPAVSLNESDLFAICIAEQALMQYRGTPLYKDLQKIFRKIEEGLSEDSSIISSQSTIPIHFLNRGQALVDSEIWKTVRNSLKKERMISIRYLKAGDQKASERLLDPFRLLSYKGEWYLIGFCHLRQKILTFALSRIQQANMLEKIRMTKEPEQFKEHLADNFGIYSAKIRHQVRILFSGRSAHIVKERLWHPEQQLEELADAKIRLSFTTGDLREIKQWVLGWGKEAVVEAPQELIEEMGREIRAMESLYFQ